MAQRLKGYRHNNMHNQRGAAERRAKDRMFLLSLNLRNVNINMLNDKELKFLAEHEAHHFQIFGYPSGGNNSIRPYHDLPYYVYTESKSYPEGHSYRTVNGDAGWGGLPDVPAVDDERYPINIDPDKNRALYSADDEYLSITGKRLSSAPTVTFADLPYSIKDAPATLEYNEANMVPGHTGHKDDMVPYADSTSSKTSKTLKLDSSKTHCVEEVDHGHGDGDWTDIDPDATVDHKYQANAAEECDRYDRHWSLLDRLEGC